MTFRQGELPNLDLNCRGGEQGVFIIVGKRGVQGVGMKYERVVWGERLQGNEIGDGKK